MNLQEAKALFFAQYLGENLIVDEEYSEMKINYILSLENDMGKIPLTDAVNNNCSLCLRSVEQLTDDEKMFLFELLVDNNYAKAGKLSIVSNELTEPNGFSVIRDYSHIKSANPKQECIFRCSIVNNGVIYTRYEVDEQNLLIAFNYMLRIGILLPFTYLSDDNKPITLQRAEIINLGWAKIKQP